MDLIDKLLAEQERRQLTDSEMADVLGISRQMWILLRLRQSPPGLRVLRGIIAAYPELTKDVLAFLRQKKGTDGARIARNGV